MAGRFACGLEKSSDWPSWRLVLCSRPRSLPLETRLMLYAALLTTWPALTAPDCPEREFLLDCQRRLFHAFYSMEVSFRRTFASRSDHSIHAAQTFPTIR